ncbi:hypothetical protein [Mycolicibacterium vaccae]|uniref:hypothetical protein n=1 Tax=Mycolicibacterium vaccae TaxID=1810 RepID=UPI003D066052
MTDHETLVWKTDDMWGYVRHRAQTRFHGLLDGYVIPPANNGGFDIEGTRHQRATPHADTVEAAKALCEDDLRRRERLAAWAEYMETHDPPCTDPSSAPPEVTTLAGIAAETHCLAESPDGFVCTEEPGHDGSHRAEEEGTGELYDVWPQQAP